MDRLRQEFRIAETPDETENGMGDALSLWQVLSECRETEQPRIQIDILDDRPEKWTLALLVRDVQGQDPKRWARRIAKRISDGDESVTFLQKQAAKSALR